MALLDLQALDPPEPDEVNALYSAQSILCNHWSTLSLLTCY